VLDDYTAYWPNSFGKYNLWRIFCTKIVSKYRM